MPLLVTGQQLADNLDIDYAEFSAELDQVAEAARNAVGQQVTAAALAAAPAMLREAAMNVAVDLYQARTAAGGQSLSADFTPGPYRISSYMLKRVGALIAPYIKVGGLVG